MKKIRLLLTIGLLCLLALPCINAQDKKVEKKIKIVMDDKSGKQIMVDTVLNDNSVDSIKLKNGEVIYLNTAPDDDKDLIVSYDSKTTPGRHTENKKNIMVTVTSQDSASDIAVANEKGHHVYTYSISGDGNDKSEKRYKVMSGLEKGDKQSGRRYVYVNEDVSGGQSGGEKFNVFTDEDLAPGDLDNTRYVVSKNGITVTIEGKDDTKIQEIVKAVEQKLGINSQEKGDKPVAKEPVPMNPKKK